MKISVKKVDGSTIIEITHNSAKPAARLTDQELSALIDLLRTVLRSKVFSMEYEMT